MRRRTVLFKSISSAIAILILAAGCSGQNPAGPTESGGPSLGVHAYAGN